MVPRGHAHVDEARLGEQRREHATDVVPLPVGAAGFEREELGAAHGDFELDRPGQEPVMEAVVLEDRDRAARAEGAREIADGVERLRKAVEAVGAEDEVEGVVVERARADLGVDESDAIGGARLGDSSARERQHRGVAIDADDRAPRADPLREPRQVGPVAAGHVEDARARAGIGRVADDFAEGRRARAMQDAERVRLVRRKRGGARAAALPRDGPGVVSTEACMDGLSRETQEALRTRRAPRERGH